MSKWLNYLRDEIIFSFKLSELIEPIKIYNFQIQVKLRTSPFSVHRYCKFGQISTTLGSKLKIINKKKTLLLSKF